MKLIYLTAQKYPSRKTEPFFHISMARAFAGILRQNFLFLVRGPVPEELRGINSASVPAPKRLRSAFYFFWLPVLVITRGWSRGDIVFFSYDPNLLAVLIFWRDVLRFKYRVVSDWHQMFGDWKDNYVARHSDYLVCTSKRLKGLLASMCGVSPDRIVVAYGGVDPDLFFEKSKIGKTEYRKKLSLPTGSFLVGYVGGFRSVGVEEKGLNTMIKALPYLDEKIRMVFVGGSAQDIDEYRALAREQGVEQRCVFVEKQRPFEKVVEHMLVMDVLVIPYPDRPHFRDYGFPMKVWEYMAAGRPIVYSNLAIMGEVLEGRATSFVPGDAASLAGAVSSVYQNRAQAEQVAGQNITDVQAYTWKARAEHILTFIHQ